MSTTCLLRTGSSKLAARASGSMRVRASVLSNAAAVAAGQAQVVPFNSNSLGNVAKLTATSTVRLTDTCKHNAATRISSVGMIGAKLSVSCNATTRLATSFRMPTIVADKFAASVDNLETVHGAWATEKLYPTADVVTEHNGVHFVNKHNTSGNLYSSIDEGVFIGNYTQHGGSGVVLADDRETYIQPSAVFTDIEFRYKCEVTKPLVTATKSLLCLRAAAPVANTSARIPPQYTIHNIRLEDPSGNLIIKYKDITLRGDADYSQDYRNFTTYFSEPETNNLLLHTWDSEYPYMESASGYTLSMYFTAECLDDPFADGFDPGYEDRCKLAILMASGDGNSYLSLGGSPLASQMPNYAVNPNHSIRISAIEIANSGGMGGLMRDTYINFYSEVSEIGQRNTRTILPVDIVTSDVDVDIYPEMFSIWKSSPDASGNIAYNTSASGAKVLAGKLQTDSPSHYITLDSNNPVLDSGRLTLKFSHQPPKTTQSYAAGAFAFGGDSNEFDSAEWQTSTETDNYFVVDSIELHVVAKKAVGSVDYALDVVGYSDDKLLNVTPKVNTFLQNTNPVYYLSTGEDELVTEEDEFIIVSGQSFGIVPVESGFMGDTGDLGISTRTLSDKGQYSEYPLVDHDPGDHYKLSDLPVVNSTTFEEYVIPLDIYEDKVSLGLSRNYHVSPHFESLYLDLYPIPSGASISTAYLVITYKPSNAMVLHTLGQTSEVELARRPYTLYPNQQNDNCIVNGDSMPLSALSGVPQTYASHSGARSNYSRRWRGVTGNLQYGPFDPEQFDFGFYNPQSLHPFTTGYYDFSEVTQSGGGYHFYQHDLEITNDDPYYLTYYTHISALGTPAIYHNEGWRFNSSGIAGVTPFRTIDFTQVALPTHSGSLLSGKISDAFSSAARLGILNYFAFNSSSGLALSDGFSLFLRFSPDSSSNSGLFLGYGTLASKYNWPADTTAPEFRLSYNGGYLSFSATDTSGTVHTVQDSKSVLEYSYPLAVLITYNDNNSKQIRLYTDSELDESHTILRGSSSPFDIIPSSSTPTPIRIGGRGTTFVPTVPMFVSDVGLSLGGCNILPSGSPNKLYRQCLASDVFDSVRMPLTTSSGNSRYMLPSFVDENTDDWNMGEFRHMSFSPDFSFLTKRSGHDFIAHSLRHIGSGYTQLTDLPLPSNVLLSGVAYHTQIENDFLRFNLSDIEDSENAFYAADTRIHKNIPRGYNFQERSIYVDTVVEQSGTDAVWADGSIGPKLIVSLYTKNQEPLDRPSKVNWGLVNRKVHQIRPSGGMHKLQTTFNYDDILDVSEPWAAFDLEAVQREFTHNYRTNDIREMFVQYDIVYPSGRLIDSVIKIHTTNVKLENALFKERNLNDSLNLVASGAKYQLANVNLHTYGLDVSYNTLNLYATASATPTASSVMNLHCSGATLAYDTLPVYCHNVGTEYTELPLYVGGRFPQFDDQTLPLILVAQPSYYATSGSVSLFVHNKIKEPYSATLNTFIRGRRIADNRFPNSSMNLVIDGLPYWTATSNDVNLYTAGKNRFDTTSGVMNMFSITYPENDEQGSFTWNG